MQLPDKMSDLLEQAIKDVKDAEVDPRFRINMSLWHFANDRGYCEVCLAGAMIRNAMPLDENYDPVFNATRFPEDVRRKLRAVNQLRCGNIVQAAIHMKIDLPRGLQAFIINPEHYGTPGFYRDMESIIEELREYDL